MMVQFGKVTDIDDWMGLVEEISWNFPGLETKEKLAEHLETVLRFMEKTKHYVQKKKIRKLRVFFYFQEV